MGTDVTRMPPPPTTDLAQLIACPQCDALYQAAAPEPGQRATCARCHSVLIAPRRKAGLNIIALAVTMLILSIGAATFPFLRISVAGLSNDASILDAMLAFSGPRLMVLSLATAALILFIPIARALLIVYVLGPIVADRPPAPGATQAFRLAEALKPWSMAEIFALGCAVSLIKVGDLANIGFGPAFWMFAILVVVVVVQDNFMCRWSVWKSLDNTPTS